MEKEELGGDEVAARAAVLVIPIILTARLLGLWLPKPLAWAISMITWMLAIYWLPTRTSLSLRRWIIIVSASALSVFLLATFEPGLF